MPKRVVVLDFDGTITDAEEEGKPFVKGYLKDLCILLGMKAEEVALIVRSAEAEIISDPTRYGWKSGGLLVAPAMVDPYLRMQAAAGYAFDKFGLFPNSSDREPLLNLLFAHNYSISGVAFKNGAAQLFHDLCTNKDVVTYIVTNSSTEGVCKKIIRLAELYPKLVRPGIQLIGGAKKYMVGNQPEHLHRAITIPGLQRWIYIQRSEYYKILEDLRQTNGVEWKDVTVIGDIFELDLAMPFELGARVGLVANEFTPQYERDFFAARPGRTSLINSLSEVLPFVLK